MRHERKGDGASTTGLDRAYWRPGMLVRNPASPHWGLGQVQSALGTRVTVTFENAGKRVMDTSVVALVADAGPARQP